MEFLLVFASSSDFFSRSACCCLFLVVQACLGLECSKQELTHWSPGKFFTCHVENFHDTERDAVMDTSSLDAQVKGLWIENQTAHFIPKFTDALEDRLEALLIDRSHLKAVTMGDLRRFPRLKHLSLSSNDLEWLDGDLFDFNSNLEKISLQGNNFKFIGAELIDSLTKLWLVSFESAGCIDFRDFGQDFHKMLRKKLRNGCKDESTELRMLVEQDKRITESTFARRLAPVLSQFDPTLTEAHFIDLHCDGFSDENICEVAEAAIDEPNTHVNSIRNERGDSFEPEILTLQGGKIIFLPMNLARAAPNLRELEVSDTGIFTVNKKSFKKLTKLVSLAFRGNKIVEISGGAFDELKNLENLDLSRNHIDSIGFAAFQGLRRLRVLDLSHNKLRNLDANFLTALTSLERLDFSSNKLNSLPVVVFAHLERLKELEISHNRISVLDSNVFSANNNIKIFAMSHNELKLISQDLLQILDEADEIDLSGNVCVDSKLLNSSDAALKMVNAAEIRMKCSRT